MADNQYVDSNGIIHLTHDHHLCELWRTVMKQHMDMCHQHGLNAGSAANLLVNGAAYLLAAFYLNDKERRIATAHEMAKVFVAKVEQSVHEIKRDHQITS
jgi:hypothetical protein